MVARENYFRAQTSFIRNEPDASAIIIVFFMQTIFEWHIIMLHKWGPDDVPFFSELTRFGSD